MASDRAARSAVAALGLLNVVLLALLFSRSSAPSMSSMILARSEQGDAGHGRKLLESLVGEELASDPQEFRRRLQQTFAFSHCFSTYQYNSDYLQMDCPFFVRPTKSASTGNAYTPSGGAIFAVIKAENNVDTPVLLVAAAGDSMLTPPISVRVNGANIVAKIDKSGNIDANGDIKGTNLQASYEVSAVNVKANRVATFDVRVEDASGNAKVEMSALTGIRAEVIKANTSYLDLVTAKTVGADEALFQKTLAVNGKVALADLAVANLAVSKKLSVSGSTLVADLGAANVVVGKKLSVAGSTKVADLAAANLGAANLAVSKSLSVQGATSFGDLAAANLAVSKTLSVAGSTQFGDLVAGNLAVSKALSVTGSATLESAVVKGEIQTRTMISSSNIAVRGDFWVSKDTTFHGKAIIRGGVTTPKLTANTCSCALDRYYHGKAAGTTGTR